MTVVTIETTTRWQTTTLLRKLRGQRAYAVQLEPGHWVVRSSAAGTATELVELERLIGEWAREEGMSAPVVRLADGGGGVVHQ